MLGIYLANTYVVKTNKDKLVNLVVIDFYILVVDISKTIVLFFVKFIKWINLIIIINDKLSKNLCIRHK